MKFFSKLMCILLTSIIISMTFLVNLDTYSFFTSRAMSSLQVEAASTEDILPLIGIVYNDNSVVYGVSAINTNNKVNPKYLLLKSSNELNSNGNTISPLIYFAVDGGASEYILHINPIRLENGDKIYKIPIEPRFSTKQISDLNKNKNVNIEGTITIKYLNEFVSETLNIQLEPEYIYEIGSKTSTRLEVQLIDEFNYVISTSMTRSVQTNKDEIIDYVQDSIIYLAQNKEWQTVEWESKASNSMVSEELGQVPLDLISDIQLTEDQIQVIDTVAPGLRDYIATLQTTIQGLIVELNKSLEEVVKLTEQMKELTTQLENISAQLTTLFTESENLKAENMALVEQNESLNQQISDLNSQLAAAQNEPPQTIIQYIEVPATGVTPITPPIDETMPPVDDATPPVDETTPPVDETTPPVDETTPPVDETIPPVDETTPPVDETTPPVDEETPPVDETTPPVGEITPSDDTDHTPIMQPDTNIDLQQPPSDNVNEESQSNDLETGDVPIVDIQNGSQSTNSEVQQFSNSSSGDEASPRGPTLSDDTVNNIDNTPIEYKQADTILPSPDEEE